MSPQVEEQGVKPKVEEQGVLGEVETHKEVATAPAALFQADTTQSTGTLPLTGADALFQVILGGLALMGGGLLFRRTRAV